MKNFIVFFILCVQVFSESFELIKEIPRDVKEFYSFEDFDKKDYILASGILASAYLLTNFDEKIKDFKDKNENSTLDDLAPVFRKFGEFYPPIILMSIGAIKEDEKAIKAGFYSAEASLLGLGITFVGKNIFSRARPYMDEGADSWNNERFNEHYSSFPSGHSTVAFATATVLAEVYKDKKYVPELMYTLASLAALSRIYDDKHWFSDVFLGSSIGYFSGRTLLKLKGDDKLIGPQIGNDSFGISIMGKF